jgi:hypothetical protein
MKQRIALVAVSALTAGVLSVASTPVANAALITSMNIFDNTAAGGIYVVAASGGDASTSQGLVATPVAGTNGTGLSQAAAMYSNGVIVVGTTGTVAAQKISISGGTLVSAATCTTAAGTLAVAADLTSCTATSATTTRLVAGIKPSAAGTALVITGYDNSAAAANWKITVTVVAAGSAGTFSASKSSIALTVAGGAPTTANVDNPGAAVAANTDCIELYYSLNDALGLPLTGASVIAKASNSAMALTIGGATGTLPIVNNAYSVATYISACQNATNVNKAVTGTVTLTVDGVDVATRTVLITGQLATITVVQDLVSVRNDAGTDNAIYGDFSARNAGTWVPSHSFTAKDAAGNLVAATVAIDTTTLDAQVIGLSGDNGSAAPLNADPDLRVGGLTFSCADTSGSNTKVKVKATAADTTTIYSNAFTVTCAGDAVNYTASTDKAAYNTGDVMTVTIKGTDKSGKAANDYGVISTTAKLGTIASGAISSSVKAPANLDTLFAGSKAYKYIIGQTTGTYTIAVDFPNVNNTTYSQSALTLPVSVKSATTEVSNADVLKSIVALIASINKQIQALQKLILARR